eukprot:4987832-Prymnesium_polylepis.1
MPRFKAHDAALGDALVGPSVAGWLLRECDFWNRVEGCALRAGSIDSERLQDDCITPQFGIHARSHACEAGFGVGQGNVSVHISEEGHVVLHDLLVDREGVGHERLIPGTVGEDDWLVLAEPVCGDCDGGLGGHVSSLLVVLRMDNSKAALI